MDFFSSFKNTYDSIGSEISKTFDSTGDEQNPTVNDSQSSPPQVLVAEGSSTPQGSGSTERHTLTPRIPKDSFTNSWDEWDSPTSRLRPSSTDAVVDNTRNRPQEKLTSGDREKVLSGDREKLTSGDREKLTSGDREKVLSGDREKVMSGDREKLTSGDREKLTSGDREKVTSGDREKVPSGDREKLTSGDREVDTSKEPLATSTPARKSTGTQAKEKMNLDRLSRDDLLKFIKKQAQLLHKTKAKFDDVSRDYEDLKKESGPSHSVASGSAIEGLAEELQIVRSERDVAVGERKSLKQDFLELTREKQDLTDRYQVLSDAHSKLKTFFQEQTQEDELADLRKSNQELVDSLSKERVTTSELTSKVSFLQKELENDKQVSSSHEKTLLDLTKQNEQLTTGKQELSEHVSQLKSEVAMLKQVSDESKELSKTLSSGLEEKNENLNSELKTLKGNLKKALSENQAIHSQLSSVRSETETLMELLSRKEDDLQTMSGERETLRSSCLELQSRVSQTKQQLLEVTEKLEAAKKEQKEAEDLKMELSVNREQLSGSLESKTDLERKVCELELENKEVVGQLHMVQGQLGDQNSEMLSLLEANRNLEQTVTCMKNENEILNCQISDSQSKVTGMELEIRTLEQTNELFQSQLSDVQLKHKTNQVELEYAEKATAGLESELCTVRGEAKKESEGLQVSNKNFSLEIENLKITVSGLENQNRTLENQNRTLENRNQTLKDALNEGQEQVDGRSSEMESLLDECHRLTAVNTGLMEQLEEVKGHWEVEKNDLKKQSDKEKEGHKEESRKLKAFVMKLKKELGEARERESRLIKDLEEKDRTDNSQISQQREMMDTLLAEKEELVRQISEANNKLEDRKESEGAKEHIVTLEKQIEELAGQLSASQANELERAQLVQSTSNELALKLTSTEEHRDLLLSELSSTQSDLGTASSQSDTQLMTIDKLQSMTQSLTDELQKERDVYNETKEKLSKVEREAQSSTLMNLELEDYQRSIRSLEAELSGREAMLGKVREESQIHQDKIHKLMKELDTAGQQGRQDKETISKMKQLLMRNKKEISESKKREADLQTSLDDLTHQMEGEKHEAEDTKVEICDLTAKLLSVKLECDSTVEMLQATLRNQELKMATLQSDLAAAQSSLTLVQGDYESYKVRVHSVLKQKSSGPGQVEINKEMKQAYDTEVSQLKSQLHDIRSHLSTTLSEHEELLLDYDQLASRHDQLLQESQVSREKLQQRIKEEEAKSERESQGQNELIAQLREEMDGTTTAFRTQINGMQQEHKKVVLSLREELHSAHSELSRLQEEADNKVLARAVSRDASQREERRGRKGMELNISSAAPPSEHRSSGVGMDRSEMESSVTSYPPTPLSREDSMSFEHLLSKNISDKQTLEKLSESELHLLKQLQTSSKKIDHLTELLRESEASSIRLSEQAKILKEEIRRLERNHEREGVSNMEYLKNVVLKFLHVTDSNEKSELVPVITKLLQLSPHEVKFVQDAIKGDIDPDGPLGAVAATHSAQGGIGKLSNYIHRWTGY